MGQFEGFQKGLDRFPGFDPVAIRFDDPQFIWSRCHREANLLELDGMNGRGRWNHSGRTRYIRRRRGVIIVEEVGKIWCRGRRWSMGMGVRAGMSGFHGTKRNWHSEHEKTRIERGLQRYEKHIMMQQRFKKKSMCDDVSVGTIRRGDYTDSKCFLFPDSESKITAWGNRLWSAHLDEVEKKGCPQGVTRTWTVKAISWESGWGVIHSDVWGRAVKALRCWWVFQVG